MKYYIKCYQSLSAAVGLCTTQTDYQKHTLNAKFGPETTMT
jgi:hypothetical protein